MNLTLTRSFYGSNATTGSMLLDGELLYSIEQPWRNNEQGKSCVPDGTYALYPYISPKHGPTWFLDSPELGVGGASSQRSYCELHSANWARQLQGCIAFGLLGTPMVDPATGVMAPAVEHSVDAIELILVALKPLSTGHVLIIVPADGVTGTS
ncbi:MAG: DUF5675 family protein [Blastocatellia bacterium]